MNKKQLIIVSVLIHIFQLSAIIFILTQPDKSHSHHYAETFHNHTAKSHNHDYDYADNSHSHYAESHSHSADDITYKSYGYAGHGTLKKELDDKADGNHSHEAFDLPSHTHSGFEIYGVPSHSHSEYATSYHWH